MLFQVAEVVIALSVAGICTRQLHVDTAQRPSLENSLSCF